MRPTARPDPLRVWTSSGSALAVGPVLDAGPTRLKRLGVAAGGYLPVLSLPRQPDLDVVGLGRREPHVARAEGDRPIGQAETLQDRFGMAGQRLQHRVGLLRPRVGDELDLVELVLPDQSAHVRAVGPRLATEAGGVGGIQEGEVPSVEELAPVEVREGHLRGGNEVQVPAVDLERGRPRTSAVARC